MPQLSLKLLLFLAELHMRADETTNFATYLHLLYFWYICMLLLFITWLRKLLARNMCQLSNKNYSEFLKSHGFVRNYLYAKLICYNYIFRSQFYASFMHKIFWHMHNFIWKVIIIKEILYIYYTYTFLYYTYTYYIYYTYILYIYIFVYQLLKNRFLYLDSFVA